MSLDNQYPQSLDEALDQLKRLHANGEISDAEFMRARKALINWQDGPSPESMQWSMFIHLAQLVGLIIIPIAGFILPIVLWQIKKLDLPDTNVHGRIVVNWMISNFIYLSISGVLSIVLIGIPFLILFGLLGIIFPVVGAVKANNGTIWKYPLSIPFLRIEEPMTDLRITERNTWGG